MECVDYRMMQKNEQLLSRTCAALVQGFLLERHARFNYFKFAVGFSMLFWACCMYVVSSNV